MLETIAHFNLLSPYRQEWSLMHCCIPGVLEPQGFHAVHTVHNCTPQVSSLHKHVLIFPVYEFHDVTAI